MLRTGAAALLALALAFALLPAGAGRAADRIDAPPPVAEAVAAANCAESGGGAAAGSNLHAAGLVVVFEGGRVETFCIEFSEEEISGAELLERSGLEVVFTGFGGLGSGVCRIEDTGCSDPGDCFCRCRGSGCEYWSYWSVRDGAWRFQLLGASSRRVRNGDVDAWVWGSGRVGPEQEALGPCPADLEATPSPSPTARRENGGGSATGAGPGTTPVVGEARAEGENALATPPAAGQTPAGGAATTTTTERTDGPRSVLERGDRGAAAADAEQTREAGAGPPAGLIAFGAVAGAVAAVGGGLALRRWRHG